MLDVISSILYIDLKEYSDIYQQVWVMSCGLNLNNQTGHFSVRCDLWSQFVSVVLC